MGLLFVWQLCTYWPQSLNNMNLSKSKNTLLFEVNSVNNYLKILVEIKNNVQKKNIIIDFNELDFKDFFKDLNNLFKKSKKNKKSFVIISSDFKSEYYNFSVDIVPSLQEAIDIIEIEEIERDLELL
jgi:hypothetical protein